MDTTDHPVELIERCAAALDVCADESVVCGVTAARLHGLWLPAMSDDVHIAIAEHDTKGHLMVRSRRSDVRPHRRQLLAHDQTTVLGVRVTEMAGTWFDLASLVDLPALVAAGDSVLRSGVARHQLVEVIERRAGQRGVRRARAALPLLDARSRSRPESHLRVASIAPDLPLFQVNVPVFRDEGGWLAEPDLSLAEAKIALEYQGADHAELHRMRRDMSRALDMRTQRWAVIPYGPAEVFGRPWQITAEVRHLVRERCPRLISGRRPRPHARRAA